MPDDMKKGMPRKVTRDAGGEMVKTVHDAADTRQKTVRDAAEVGVRAAQRGVEATSYGTARTVSAANGAASQLAGAAAGVTRQMAEQSAGQFSGMFTTPIEASEELTKQAQQHMDVLMQTGIVLADGFQSIMREWVDYAQKAMRQNIDGVNGMMRARTLQDLASAQNDFLMSEVQLMLNSSVRISQATAHVAEDAVQRINERTQRTRRNP